MMTSRFNRRQALTIGAGAVAFATLGLPVTPAFAKNNIDDVVGNSPAARRRPPARSSSMCPRSPKTETPCR